MNLSAELSSIETELESLRTEVKILREAKIVADFELDQLRRRDEHLTEKCDFLIASNAELKTIVDQAGANLVSSIQKYHERRREPVAQDDTRLIERAAE